MVAPGSARAILGPSRAAGRRPRPLRRWPRRPDRWTRFKVAGTSAYVAGWAAGQECRGSTPIQVHIYVNGAGYPFIADKARAGCQLPSCACAGQHGFSEYVPLQAWCTTTICAYAIGVTSVNAADRVPSRSGARAPPEGNVELHDGFRLERDRRRMGVRPELARDIKSGAPICRLESGTSRRGRHLPRPDVNPCSE